MSLLIIAIVMYAALHDLRDCTIPNHAVVAIILIGITQSLMTSFGVGSFASVTFASAGVGLLAGLGLSILLHLFGVFGAGDAKLLAALGAAVGYPDILSLIAVSVIFTGIFGIARLACYGELSGMLVRWKNAVIFHSYEPAKTNSTAASGIPMGGAILLATLFYHFYLL